MRPARASLGRASGFTLLEVLVVVAIVAIIVGLAGVRLLRSPDEAVREECERLALLLQAAREEAILQGRVFTFGARRDTYGFLRLERDGKLKLAKDDELLHPRRLPAGITIEAFQVEGVAEDAPIKGVVFQPSGDLPAFRILLAGSGMRWSVVGSPDGTIRAQAGS
jgi:general secretion pathway protein H